MPYLSRRTVRDCERLPGHHEAMVHWAMTITMTRRLARRRQPFKRTSPRFRTGPEPYVIAGLGLRMMCQAEIIRW